jgi:hypothetical protein
VSETTTPTLRVISGAPTPEELAVVTALVAAAGGGDEAAPAPAVRRGGWNDPAATHRQAIVPGPNGWRSAGGP